MYSDQMFLLLSAAVALIEMAAVCWVWERKMKQAEQRAGGEQRRKARCHDGLLRAGGGAALQRKKEDVTMNKFLLKTLPEGSGGENPLCNTGGLRNIANPNMEAEKRRKLTIELTFKPDKNDRTDVDVTAIVKTSLQPQKAIASRMIVESDGRGNVLGQNGAEETMKGQMGLTGRKGTQETSGA